MSEQNGITGSIKVGEGVELGTAYLAGTAPHDMMTEEECVRHGGHCFEAMGEATASIPPQYRQECRHCGKQRVAVPREPFEYRDWPPSAVPAAGAGADYLALTGKFWLVITRKDGTEDRGYPAIKADGSWTYYVPAGVLAVGGAAVNSGDTVSGKLNFSDW